MKKYKDEVLFASIIIAVIGAVIFILNNVVNTSNQSSYLYSLTGSNDMTIEDIESNSKLECLQFKDCAYLDEVTITIGDHDSIQVTHPNIEVDKSQYNMWDVVSSTMIEHTYLSKYIAENYEGCEENPVKIVYNYNVNGLDVQYISSTKDFEDYYSENIDTEIFTKFMDKAYIFRYGDKIECDSFDRALMGEK